MMIGVVVHSCMCPLMGDVFVVLPLLRCLLVLAKGQDTRQVSWHRWTRATHWSLGGRRLRYEPGALEYTSPLLVLVRVF